MFKLFAVLLIYNSLIYILWWKKNIKLFLLTNNKLLFFPNKIQISNHVKLGTFKLFVGWTFHHFIRHLLFPYGQYLTQLNTTEHKVTFVFIYLFLNSFNIWHLLLLNFFFLIIKTRHNLVFGVSWKKKIGFWDRWSLRSKSLIWW